MHFTKADIHNYLNGAGPYASAPTSPVAIQLAQDCLELIAKLETIDAKARAAKAATPPKPATPSKPVK